MTTARRLLTTIALSAYALCALPAHAEGVLEKVKARGAVRVCIWPDYYGVTYRHPRSGELSGIDIDLSRKFGKDLGVAVEYVDSSFPNLVPDIQAQRCDVGMFAIAMLAQRMDQLAFSTPYLRSDIYAIATRSSAVVRNWQEIDQPGVKVAVQAGTFMEPVMRGALKKATLVSIAAPKTREMELESGRVDVFMTDYPYSKRLLENADWARLISPPKPFHVLPYAYAVRQGDEAWRNTVDEFVQRIKRDGSLMAAARKAGLAEIVEP